MPPLRRGPALIAVKDEYLFDLHPMTQGIEQVNVATVKTNAQDLRRLLKEANFTDRKAFLRSFTKRIEASRNQVKVYYNLPIPQDEKTKAQAEVLPIDTLGGPKCTIDRTFSLKFALSSAKH